MSLLIVLVYKLLAMMLKVLEIVNTDYENFDDRRILRTNEKGS